MGCAEDAFRNAHVGSFGRRASRTGVFRTLDRSPKIHRFEQARAHVRQQRFATEPAAANTAEQLASSLSIMSGEDGAARPSSTAEPKLESISLTGAAALLLLLLSEGLIRLARMSTAKAWRRPIRARLNEIDSSSLATGASDHPSRWVAPSGDARRPETGLSELRRVLRRADAGLRPSRSFAPSQSIIRKHVRAKSAFQRLKTQSFSPRWAPL